MRVCECACRGDDEVSDEEADDKVTSLVDDLISDEMFCHGQRYRVTAYGQY